MALLRGSSAWRAFQKRTHRLPCAARGRSHSVNLATVTEEQTPRLRFAPSPTGQLHLGGLRTALLNHILARQGKGKWVLRVEDTDQERLVPGAVDSMRRSLEWAGLEYDEGPGVGGSSGPYYQSERLDLYQQHAEELLKRDMAYQCFCSPAELLAIRKALHNQKVRVNYDGRCRHLTDEERARRRKAGHKYVIRFKDPGRLPDLPEDMVFGQVKAHTDIGTPSNFVHDDFVIMKSDGFPVYHLANVIDDHYMGITHVLRGEEWLSSLPKHVSLYNAFGWNLPHFGHLPLMVNSDGSKLSKRHGGVSVDSYKERGYEPEAIVNFLALVGWDFERSIEEKLQYQRDHQPDPNSPSSLAEEASSIAALSPHLRNDGHSLYEIFTLPQIIDTFNIDHLQNRKVGVNLSKLDFLNKMHIRRKAGRLGKDGGMVNFGKGGAITGKEAEEREELIKRFQADLRNNVQTMNNHLINDWDYIAEIFDIELPRIRIFNELAETSLYWFEDPDYETDMAMEVLSKIDEDLYVQVLSAAIPILSELAKEMVHFNGDVGWDLAAEIQQSLGLKRRGPVLMVMRHAITGQTAGPAVPDVIPVLGPKRTIKRLQKGLDFVKARIAEHRNS